MARGGEAKRWEGRLLDGRYRIGERLGEGGMGSVYLAAHVGLGQRRAVKFLHDDLASRPDAVKRFQREVRVLASLRHEHIIEVADVGECEGIAYYVMELLAGEDLRTLLRRERALPWARARRIALQVCDALTAAHAAGVVHRDMKPENCFCVRRSDGGDFIKVLDFGIAKLLGGGTQLTATGETLGTVSYMPPEQVEGGGDHRIDVYAIGVMLYEMLAGRLPHEGNAVEVIARLVRGVAPPRLGLVCPGVPEEIERVVMRAMATAPEARYADMGALRAALAVLPEGPPGVAAPGREQSAGGVGWTTFGNLPTELPQDPGSRPAVDSASRPAVRGDEPAGGSIGASPAAVPEAPGGAPPVREGMVAAPSRTPVAVQAAPERRGRSRAAVLGVLVVLAVWLGWRMWPASEPGVVAGAAEVPGDAVLQSPEVPERPETPQASGAPGGSSVEPEGAVAPGEPEPTRSEPVTPEPPRTAGEPEPARDGGATGTIEAATEKKEVAPRALTEEAFKRRLRGALDDCRSTTDDASVKVRAQVKAGRLGALEVVEAVGLSPLKVDCVKTKLPDLRSTSVAFTTRELKVKLPRRS